MSDRLKEFFDPESSRVLAASLSGSAIQSIPVGQLMQLLIGLLTLTYLALKIRRQWKRRNDRLNSDEDDE